MSNVNYTYTFTPGTNAKSAEVNQNFTDVKAVIEGGLDSDNLTSTTAQRLGLSTSGANRRGSVSVATEASSANAGYVDLAGVSVALTVPTGALVMVCVKSDLKTSDAAHACTIGVDSGEGGTDMFTTTSTTYVSMRSPDGASTFGAPVFLTGLSGVTTIKLRVKSDGAATSYARNMELYAWVVGF